jgi:hypothetical protein
LKIIYYWILWRCVMEKSVMVKIDEATYQELERLTQEQGARLEETLVEAVEAYLEQRKAYMRDPFFQIGKAGRSGLGDLAEAHDKYLYSVEDDR